MRTTLSLCCLLALGLSGLGSRPKPQPDPTQGIFSIHSPGNDPTLRPEQPAQEGFIRIARKPGHSLRPADNLLELSMLQLTTDEQNNGRGVERIRYIF